MEKQRGNAQESRGACSTIIMPFTEHRYRGMNTHAAALERHSGRKIEANAADRWFFYKNYTEYWQEGLYEADIIKRQVLIQICAVVK